MNNNFNQNYNVGNGVPVPQQRGNQPKQPEREPLRLQVDPVDFDGVLRTKAVTSIDLAKEINKIFRPVISDFKGTVILPNQFGQLELTMFFVDKGPAQGGQIKGLTRASIMPSGKESGIEKIKFMNMRNRAKTYDLTDECKEILSEFIHVKPGQKIDWDRIVVEQTQQQYGNYVILVRIGGLDLQRIIRKKYGTKNSDGDKVDYNVTIGKAIGQDYGYGYGNFLLNILQLNVKEMEKICMSAGLMPSSGQVFMVE